MQKHYTTVVSIGFSLDCIILADEDLIFSVACFLCVVRDESNHCSDCRDSSSCDDYNLKNKKKK